MTTLHDTYLSPHPRGLSGDPEVFFCGTEAGDKRSDDELREWQTNIGLLAAELKSVVDDDGNIRTPETWEELAKGEFTYMDYLAEIEKICRPKSAEKIAKHEQKIKEYADGQDIVWVSGVVGIRENKDGITGLLLSKTAEKDWTYQPHGGKRVGGEGPLATLLRETAEELGLAAAIALLRALREGKADYIGYYASPMGNGKVLAIQNFAITGEAFESISLKSGSDSQDAVWISLDQLPEDLVPTSQLDDFLRTLGADVPETNFTRNRNQVVSHVREKTMRKLGRTAVAGVAT